MEAVVSWLAAHWAVVALAVKSLLDLVFLLDPAADAPGGVLDWLYQALKKALGSGQ